MKTHKALLASIVLALVLVGCTLPSWVQEAENIVSISMPIVTSIAGIVDPQIGSVVSAIGQGLSILMNQFQVYQKNPNASTLTQINAQLAQLNAQIQQVENTANIKDPDTQVKVQQILTLIAQEMQAVSTIVAQNSPASAQAIGMHVSTQPVKLDSKKFHSDIMKIIDNDPRFPKF